MELRNTDFISKDTSLYVSLAESPGNIGTRWFNKVFTEQKIDAVYKAIRVDRDEFSSAWQGVKALKIAGGAISMPFKKQAATLVDELAGIASEIGTINTFRREKNGKIIGFNTDYVAALKALPVEAKSIYLFGGGGVAASIAMAVKKKNLPKITVITRSRDRVLVPSSVDYVWESWSKAGDLPGPEVLVNCSSLGMFRTAELEVPESWLKNIKLAIDLTYRPEGNAFFHLAHQQGIPFVDGKMFARWQAIEQFYIYSGIRLDELSCGY